MIIKNGLVFKDDFSFHKDNLYINNEHEICRTPIDGDNEIIDAEGLYVIPGLVDIHIHGAVGHDFCDADIDGLSKIAAYLKTCGITSFCPTSMTLPETQLTEIFKSADNVKSDSCNARIAGINMEGPFISSEKKGAQKEIYLASPDIDMFNRLYDASRGRIKLVTLAPELQNANNFINELHEKVNISLGHSAASYETAKAAFNAGCNHVTHLFNAMNPFHHREPGIVGAAADNQNVMVEIICDGIHIHPSVIRSVFRMFGDDRVILISDAMRATGMEDGEYELGGQNVFKKGSHATLKDGTLAGSVTNLFDCMKNAVSFGIPLESAIKASTYNPAKSIGAENSIGTLKSGAKADILLIDKNLNLILII